MSDQEQSVDLVARAMAVYNEHLKTDLERDHFGKLIAVEPESGEYVLATRFRELELKTFERFEYRPTHMFRVGGGGAVRIGAGRARTS